MVILILYVDYLLIIGDDLFIDQCRKDLVREFKMNYLELLHYFLRLELRKNFVSIILNQGKYILHILKRFGM